METSTTFAELGLSAKVLEAITAAGYTIPTPIQAQGIPVAVSGRDILGIAQTGTGKTAAFVMPMISRLETGRARARMPRSLILAPTRELAAQVAASFEKYGKNHKLTVALLIGGVSMDDQTAKLDRGVDVLIATPGRLMDHFQRGRVMLMGVEILVIDEADRMLDMGFIPDIEKICKLLPPKRQTLFFSATMPAEITRLSEAFLTNPERIEVARPATTASTITKRFVFCPDGDDHAKREVLRGLIKTENVRNAIIFCNRKKDVAILHKSLLKHGFNAGALHGDMDQSSRTATLDKFRAGEILLLAASDVAARGLDIPDVSHVFNFDVPWAGDDYVHRIGRTGRAGREGFAATLVSLDDIKAINEIEKITGEAPVWLGDAPTAEDLTEGASRKRRRGKAPAAASGSRGAPAGGRARTSSESRTSRESPSRENTSRNRPSGAQLLGDRPPRDRQATAGGRRSAARDPAARDPAARDPAAREAVPVHAVGSGEAALLGSQPEGQSDSRERSRNRRQRGTGDRPQPRDRIVPRAPIAVMAGTEEQPRTEPASRRQPRPPREDRAREAQPLVSAPRAQPMEADQPREERSARQQDRSPQRADMPRPERSRHDRSPQDRSTQDRPLQERARADRPHSDRPRPERGDRGDRGDGPRVGFADNVPAFLKKPVRSQ